MTDLAGLLGILADHRVDFIVVGGAAVIHGSETQCDAEKPCRGGGRMRAVP